MLSASLITATNNNMNKSTETPTPTPPPQDTDSCPRCSASGYQGQCYACGYGTGIGLHKPAQYRGYGSVRSLPNKLLIFNELSDTILPEYIDKQSKNRSTPYALKLYNPRGPSPRQPATFELSSKNLITDLHQDLQLTSNTASNATQATIRQQLPGLWRRWLDWIFLQ
ncbi:uncharacterized protein PAC_11117 [Phialocephala subalpina]|uniref:Uncharacterized protein n=1 Tax=Phialocephala subalpina TaxID=576137 RepID=A0A1L7X880_9HELO|nr:uncharacterized protein PAC_11117 [Phialocephala subalpina]